MQIELNKIQTTYIVRALGMLQKSNERKTNQEDMANAIKEIILQEQREITALDLHMRQYQLQLEKDSNATAQKK